MNERIRELWRECVLKHTNDPMNWQLAADEFAGLIVRECSAVANHFSDGHEVRQFDDSKRYLYFVDVGKVVLEHFGVEE
jgi:hypothetical protein